MSSQTMKTPVPVRSKLNYTEDKNDASQEEIGKAIMEAVKVAPYGISKDKFKSLVLFILWRDNIQGDKI